MSDQGYLSVDANPGTAGPPYGNPDVWVPARPGEHNRGNTLHHHDKHAAHKDGHRPDDPNAVTAPAFGTPGTVSDAEMADSVPVTSEEQRHRELAPGSWQRQQARNALLPPGLGAIKQQELDAVLQKHDDIQSILNAPHGGTIRREGHEPYSEETDYGQRVSAFGKVERDAVEAGSWDKGGYTVEGDELVDMVEGEEDQAFAKKAMYGQPGLSGREQRETDRKSGRLGLTEHGIDRVGQFQGEQHQVPDGPLMEFNPTLKGGDPKKGGAWSEVTKSMQDRRTAARRIE